MVKRVAWPHHVRPPEYLASGRAGTQVRRSSLFVSHGNHVETNGMRTFAPRPDDCNLARYQNLHVPSIIIRHRVRSVATYYPIGWSEVDLRRDDSKGAHSAETACLPLLAVIDCVAAWETYSCARQKVARHCLSLEQFRGCLRIVPN
jgi:hypothetical protein